MASGKFTNQSPSVWSRGGGKARLNNKFSSFPVDLNLAYQVITDGNYCLCPLPFVVSSVLGSIWVNYR